MIRSMMTYSEYMDRAMATVIYKPETSLMYLITGFVGEFGELAEKILGDSKPEGIIKEAGDVTWYGAALCKTLNYDIESVFLTKETQPSPGDSLINKGLLQVAAINELIKKHLRDDYDHKEDGFANFNNLRPIKRKRLEEYITNTIHITRRLVFLHTDTTFREVLEKNLNKLESRKNRGQLKGSGDNR